MEFSSPWTRHELAAATETPPEYASFGDNLRAALAMASWRQPRDPLARMSALAMAGIFAAVALLGVAADLVQAGGEWRNFTPYGLNSELAELFLMAGVILAFSHIDRTQATTRRLALVFALMTVVSLVEHFAVYALYPDRADAARWTPTNIAVNVVAALVYVWLIGAVRQAFRQTPRVRRPLLRAVAFIVVLILAAVVAPTWPVFVPRDFDRNSANAWEYGRARLYAKQNAEDYARQHAQQTADEAQAARLEAEQGAMLARAVGKLPARDPSRANVFTIGVAGWSDQDVFLKEIQQSTDILKSHFHWGERTLNLINNAATAQDAPMASMANLGEALRAVAQRMDRDNDLLVLVLSSHGSHDGFALNYGDYVQRELDPQTLRLMLDETGIRNRVVIVSSCYSGTFVAPLQNPDTMVLTAASSDRTSFGCADDRRWTWFGEALFEKGLAEQPTLADAFAAAKTTISGWESEQGLPASQPQIFVGDALARRFPAIVGQPKPESHAAAAPAPAPPKAE